MNNESAVESPDGRSDTPRRIGRKVLRAREQVEDVLRAAILAGEIRSGERLPSEAELARQFDVSRNTVREALHALATQNLIYKVPGAGGGSFVRSVDHESLGDRVSDAMQSLLALGRIQFEEVAMVRQHLEVPAVRAAAEHRTAEDLERLHAIVREQMSVSVDDPVVSLLDAQFHVAIATASRNRVLSALVAALHRQTEPVRYLDLSPEVGQVTVRQHLAILVAIEQGDPNAAERAIIEHLSYLREHLLAHD
ncbi:FadR/GntR family transcriptional regulator [Nocardia sp. NPDC052278]|uniref:FadR/GntR family transcriptional regulator n=1 Tax=unclassified Nocardia TaxID=2637762 RepID=UPI0036928AE1